MDSDGLMSSRKFYTAIVGLAALAVLATIGLRKASVKVSAGARMESKADPDSAGKLMHLVDYVAGDYHEAVSGGRIIDQEEYDEQVEFIGKAERVLDGFPDGPSRSALSTLLARLGNAVEFKADPSVVKNAVAGIRNALETTGTIAFSPAHAPDAARGRMLFSANCARCHGATGHGDGPDGVSLSPRPADFHDCGRMAGRTPAQAYNTVRFGVDGTGMPSFAGLPSQDVWDLAYFILSLSADSKVAGAGLN